MRRVDLREQELPTMVRAAALKLLASVQIADNVQALRLAEQRAEGFVLGLETASAYRAETIETLYIGFEQAVADRLDALRDIQ